MTGVSVLLLLNFLRDLRLAMDAATAKCALLLLHGVWRMPNDYTGPTARHHDAPLVLLPLGMSRCAALEFSARRKRLS